jgi:hypothetical protein
MDSAYEIYRKICDLPEVLPHSQVAAHPKDIDLYVPATSMLHAKLIFDDNLYICIKDSTCHCIYYKFIRGELFLFDLCSDYNFYFDLFPKVRFSDEGNLKLGRDLLLNKIVKNFSRNGNFSDADFPILNRFFAESENFLIYPRSLPKDDTAVQLLGNLIVKSRWLGRFRVRLHNFINYYKEGKSYAFIGPDGSGKGFFIDKLKKTKSVKVIYMGDWFFKMQPLYSLVMKLPSPSNRFLYLFYYIENTLRRLKVAFWVALGKTVFIDRFPGTNTPISLSGVPGLINRLIFNFTVKPDHFVILYASPSVIFDRKQELTISEIEVIQEKQQELISGYSHVVINTEQLDDSLNFLLAKLYEH